MALHRSSLGRLTDSHRDLAQLLVIAALVAAIVLVILVATALLGVQQTAPLYEILPDPAGIELPF